MKKKRLILLYRSILLLVILIGLTLNFKAKNGNLNLFISYYTIQSNIIVFIFLLLEIVNYFKTIKFFKNETVYQNLKGMVTLIILITGIIFAIILTPYVKDWTGYRLYSSYILHYISPIMILIDFLFFDKLTTKLSVKKNIYWLIYPLMYYIFGIIRALIFDGFIPYPFMDVQSLGAIKSLITVFFLIFFFYSFSIVLIFVKNRLSKVTKIKK